MSIFPDNLTTSDVGSHFLKAVEMIDRKLKIVGVEIVKANNAQFGAIPADSMFQRGMLKEGEILRYTFLDEQGSERLHESKSMTLYIAFKNAEIDTGDTIIISRTGQGKTTRYLITKVE